ncbi:hypothetical protein GQ43DRAFT_469559 [Delitschia confertaspora ATCC 74209]|uniref:Uncharacterized protein n=1 Tax=Delitschia confertaspora ATCC 74209 TaxID=1513339 RepID=A0A9P4N1J8_9PLEO|nr:hypothetical protein GQ43DRAFT_469559 [Delitschia confertaspora ATCC 74209]
MAANKCFYPNKGLAENDTPCNESSEFSHCCRSDELCLSNGLCLGGPGELVQASCTDQTWSSGRCFQQCKQAEGPLPITSTGITVKGSNNSRLWCCDVNMYNKTSQSCLSGGVVSQPFAISNGLFVTDRKTGSTAVFNSTNPAPEISCNASTPSAATITVFASPSASSHQLLQRSLGLGLGLGIPLLIVLLMSLILVRREREKSKEAWETLASLQQQQQQQHHHQNGGVFGLGRGGHDVAYAHDARPPLVEIGITEVQEMDSKYTRPLGELGR